MRKGRAIRRLRRVLLAATVLAVATVVGLLIAGRSGRPPAPAEEEEVSLEPTGEMVTVGEGFERTFSEGDRPLFTVRGDRYSVDREGIVYLEGVEVRIYQEDGSVYVIEGEKARFDVEKREGRLGGGVRFAAPDGFELTTQALRVTREGKQVQSTSPVEFRIGDAYQGEARGLVAALEGRRFRLEKYVKIVSLPGAEEPLRLEAAGLLLDRERDMVRSDGWAVLHRRSERVSALDMDVFFAEDERTLRFIRGTGEVQGLFLAGGAFAGLALDAPPGSEADPADPGIRRIELRSDLLTLLLAEDGREPRQVDLEGGPGGLARLRTLGPPEAPSYRLTGPAMTGWFRDGEPSRVRVTGGMTLVMREGGGGGGEAESEEGASARTVTAGEGVAFFGPEGALSRVELEGGVTVAQGGAEARGERGVYDPVEERAELEGDVVLTDPEGRASGARGVFDLRRDRGDLVGRPAVAETDALRMEAPRLRYTRAEGLVHGTGGVRARLEEADESALGGSPLARGEGPVWVEAEEGSFREQPRSFHFQGSVRAWRGDDLLVANELRGEGPEERLVATGEVRTLWVPEEDEIEEATGDGAADSGGAGEPGGSSPAASDAPLEVRSETLVYHKDRRLLVYTGGVVARQQERTLGCREMEVQLAEEGGVAELRCAGDARVEDPVEGRTLRGDTLHYRPDRRLVVVTAAEGKKVRMRDREGNVVEGARMTYDVDTGQVQVFGRADGTVPAPDPATPPAPPSAAPEPATEEPPPR